MGVDIFMLRTAAGFIREHKLIFVNAALMAFLMVAPLLAFPLMAGDGYQGINIANHGFDELWYLSRAREALDGHHLGNALWREGKEGQDPFFNYVEYAIFAPLRILGLAPYVDVTVVYAVLNTVGVFVLLLLIYFFVLQLSANKPLSVISALLAVGGYSLAMPSSFLSINVYSRAMTPYIPALITFLYLNFLAVILRRQSWRCRLAAGLALGSLFYVYFYAWSFILTLNAFLILFYIIKREYAVVRSILIVSGVGLLIGSYNVFNAVYSQTGEFARQLTYFHWISYSHAPVFNAIGFIALLLAAVAWRKLKLDNFFFLFIAIILTGWAVLNQQIVTGILIQSEHYYAHFIVPTSLIVCAYVIWILLKREAYKRFLVIGLALFVYFTTGVGQARAVLTNYELKQSWQKYRPIIDYLNRQPEAGVALTADDANAYLITIYTSHDIFWARSFLLVNVPLERRLRDTLFVYSYLNNKSRNDIVSYLRAPGNKLSFYWTIYETLEGYSSGLAYFDYYKKSAAKDPLISGQRERLMASLAGEYERLAKNNAAIKQLLKKYGVAYIVWDKGKYPEWDLSFLNLSEAVSSDNIFLYKVNL